MKIQKKYPSLFKALSKPYGARKAISLITGLEEDLKLGKLSLLYDLRFLSGSFVYKNTSQGHSFWAKISEQHLGW